MHSSFLSNIYFLSSLLMLITMHRHYGSLLHPRRIKIYLCTCQALGYREYYVSVFWYQVYEARLLITLVDIARLAERFNMCSQSRDWSNWYQKTRTWYSIYQFTHCFTLQTSDYDVIFYFCIDDSAYKRRHSKSATSSWPDKDTCHEIDNVYQATCNNVVYMSGNW